MIKVTLNNGKCFDVEFMEESIPSDRIALNLMNKKVVEVSILNIKEMKEC